MSQLNSSTETLKPYYYDDGNHDNVFQVDDRPKDAEDPQPPPPPPKRKRKTPTGLLQSFHDSIARVLEEHSEGFRFLTYVILHVLLVAYFAWATYYFIENGNDTLDSTTCTGYGFGLILFALINFGVFYYWFLKPYVMSPIGKSLWRPLKAKLSRLVKIRFVKPLLYLAIFVAIGGYLIYDTDGDRQRLVPLIGLCAYLLFGFLFSRYPGQINWRPVVWGLILQFVFGALTIRWEVGRNVFGCIGNKTTTFLGYAVNGSAFVYSDFLVHEKGIFAFQALSTIYFLGFIINILYHYGIMQKVVVTIGEFLQAVMGTTICESVNSAANIFLGQTEAPLLIKPYLKDLTASEIHSIMASGFATVSGTVLAAYISFGASAAHLITASVMSAPAALCYSKLLYPEIEEIVSTKESIVAVESEFSSVLDAASKGATLAVEIVLGIIANLIAFIATVYFINGVLLYLGELVGYTGDDVWSVERIVGYVFMPMSFIMGVPWDECEKVGRLIGIKTIVNEFAAFAEMSQMDLEPKTKVIATYAISGFSNPGSIGIQISAFSVLMPSKRPIITSVVFRAFIAGSMVCFMTACIAALLIPTDMTNI